MIKGTELWQVNNNADNRLGVDSLRVARKIIWKKIAAKYFKYPWLLKLILFVYFFYLFTYFSVTFSDVRLAGSVNKSFFTSYGDLH